MQNLTEDRVQIFRCPAREKYRCHVHYIPVHLPSYYRGQYGGTDTASVPVAGEQPMRRPIKLADVPWHDDADVRVCQVRAGEQVISVHAKYGSYNPEEESEQQRPRLCWLGGFRAIINRDLERCQWNS